MTEYINADEIEAGDEITVEYESNRSDDTVTQTGEVEEVSTTEAFDDTRKTVRFVNDDDGKSWEITQVETSEATWATVSAMSDMADEGHTAGNGTSMNRVSTRGGVVSVGVESDSDGSEIANVEESGTDTASVQFTDGFRATVEKYDDAQGGHVVVGAEHVTQPRHQEMEHKLGFTVDV